MNLKALIFKYIAYRKAMGEKFHTNETYLKAFSKAMGDDVDIKHASTEKIAKFLYGHALVTSAWFIKYAALTGFYEYAIGRGFIDFSPLPKIIPKKPPAFVPYIFIPEKNCVSYSMRFSHIRKIEVAWNPLWFISF